MAAASRGGRPVPGGPAGLSVSNKQQQQSFVRAPSPPLLLLLLFLLLVAQASRAPPSLLLRDGGRAAASRVRTFLPPSSSTKIETEQAPSSCSPSRFHSVTALHHTWYCCCCCCVVLSPPVLSISRSFGQGHSFPSSSSSMLPITPPPSPSPSPSPPAAPPRQQPRHRRMHACHCIIIIHQPSIHPPTRLLLLLIAAPPRPPPPLLRQGRALLSLSLSSSYMLRRSSPSSSPRPSYSASLFYSTLSMRPAEPALPRCPPPTDDPCGRPAPLCGPPPPCGPTCIRSGCRGTVLATATAGPSNRSAAERFSADRLRRQQQHTPTEKAMATQMRITAVVWPCTKPHSPAACTSALVSLYWKPAKRPEMTSA